MPIERPEPTDEKILETLQRVKEALYTKIAEKGRGAFVTMHEITGVIDEEFNIEFKAEVHKRNGLTAKEELLDIVVAALWGYISMDTVER